MWRKWSPTHRFDCTEKFRPMSACALSILFANASSSLFTENPIIYHLCEPRWRSLHGVIATLACEDDYLFAKAPCADLIEIVFESEIHFLTLYQAGHSFSYRRHQGF